MTIQKARLGITRRNADWEGLKRTNDIMYMYHVSSRVKNEIIIKGNDANIIH